MRCEEVLELMKDLYCYFGDMGLIFCVGNNYWFVDDSYVLRVYVLKLYWEDLERIFIFVKECNLEVFIDIRYGFFEIEFYDIKYVGGDW